MVEIKLTFESAEEAATALQALHTSSLAATSAVSKIAATLPDEPVQAPASLFETDGLTAQEAFNEAPPQWIPAESVAQAAAPAESVAQAAAPAESVAQAAASYGGDVDSKGRVWDARIHAASKQKLVKTNEWKLRRKPKDVDQAAWENKVTSVNAELDALSAIPPAPAAASPQTTAVTEPANAPAPLDFPGLLQRIATHGIPAAEVTRQCNALQITSLPLIAQRPDLIPQLCVLLGINE